VPHWPREYAPMITVKLTTTIPEVYEFVENRFSALLEQTGLRKLTKITKWTVRNVIKHVVHNVDKKILYFEKEPFQSSFLIRSWIIPQHARWFYMDSKVPFALFGIRLQQESASVVQLAIDDFRNAKKHGILPATIGGGQYNKRLLITVIIAIIIVILSIIFFVLIILMIGPAIMIVYDWYKKKRQRIYEKETMGIISGIFVLEFNKDSTLLDSHMVSRQKWRLRSVLHEIVNFFNPFQPDN